MQVVILCGGAGTRMWPLTEETPKPLITIGGKPILWHIMKMYAKHGHKDFIVCLGHLGEKIWNYFSEEKNVEPDWKINFVNTGKDSTKAERLMKVKDLIKDSMFFVSYGDDISDVDINEVHSFHKKMGKLATFTAVNPESQFGIAEIEDDGTVHGFKEKPRLGHWINGGFFVFDKRIFDYMKPGLELEKEVFESLAKESQLCAYKHLGFWRCMNTMKDAQELNHLWERGELFHLKN